jgi:hypothetical protein
LTNSSQATLYGSQQQSGPLSIDLKGNLYVRAIDPSSGLTQSVIPASDSIGFNGIAAGNFYFTDIGLSLTATTGSTTTVLAITGAGASGIRVNDYLIARAGTAGNLNSWSYVTAVGTNSVTVGTPFPTAPANTDTFIVLRPQPMIAQVGLGGQYRTSVMSNIDNNYQPNQALGILKLENGVAADGDAGVAVWAVRNEGAADFGNANLDYNPIAVTRTGAVEVIMNTAFNGTSGGKDVAANEDSAFADADAVIKAGGVNNRSVTAYNTTNGDVTPIGVNDYGGVFCDLDPRYSGNTIAPNQREDTAFADQNGVMIAGGQSLSAIAQSVGTSGDVAPIAMDLGNRQVVTAAPSGEMVVGCNTAVTTATTGTVIAAVASKFTFITSLSCTNTGGTASRVILEDGDGTDLANVFLAATSGFAAVSFPTPVRTNVVNKAIQVNVITSGSSTICCASGYTGVI